MDLQETSAIKDVVVGIIGGSGLYHIADFELEKEVEITTPFGKPSGTCRVGKLQGVKAVFLARHGENHSLLPSEVPYRANIYALKSLGVTHIISVSAVGSLCEEMAPRHMVVVDQYIDFTKTRIPTFFGQGLIAHVSMAKPTCENLGKLLHSAAEFVLKATAHKAHLGGTYVCIEGPQFSTRAESLHYKSLGIHVIGMTNMPEAKLAREAQIAYAPLAMVTDYDCWRSQQSEDEAVNVHALLDNLRAGADNAQKIVARAIMQLGAEKTSSPAHTALQTAVYTPYTSLSQEKKDLLDFLRS